MIFSTTCSSQSVKIGTFLAYKNCLWRRQKDLIRLFRFPWRRLLRIAKC